MDSSSSQANPILEDIYDLFSKLEESNNDPQYNQRHTVIKFTKIPDQDNVSTSKLILFFNFVSSLRL